MSSYGYDLLRGGEQRGKDLLAGGEQKEPELFSSGSRRRAEPAQGASGGADVRRESDQEQLAA